MATQKKKAAEPVRAAEYCGNCRFYLADGDLGICRRYPGQVVIEGEDAYTALPQKEPSEWCGEHQMKGLRQ